MSVKKLNVKKLKKLKAGTAEVQCSYSVDQNGSYAYCQAQIAAYQAGYKAAFG